MSFHHVFNVLQSGIVAALVLLVLPLTAQATTPDCTPSQCATLSCSSSNPYACVQGTVKGGCSPSEWNSSSCTQSCNYNSCEASLPVSKCSSTQCAELSAAGKSCSSIDNIVCVSKTPVAGNYGGCSSTAWTANECSEDCDFTTCNNAYPAVKRTITITNSCSETVWVGFTGGKFTYDKTDPIKSEAGKAISCSKTSDCPSSQMICGDIDSTTNKGSCYWSLGWDKKQVLDAGDDLTVTLSNQPVGNKATSGQQFVKISGNIWASTGCDSNGKNCDTALTPSGYNSYTGPLGPTTLAEFTLLNNVVDYYDISIINGINLPVEMKPTAGQTYGQASADPTSDFYCGNPGSTDSPNANLGSCIWATQKGETHVIPMVKAGGKSCTETEGQCSNGKVCGLSLDTSNNTVNQVCGERVGWWTADEVCAFTDGNANVAGIDCGKTVGTGNLTELLGCASGSPFNASCYSKGATSSCCGCENWGFTLNTGKCENSNSNWATDAKPWIEPVKKMCPTAYSYPFDDKTSTFKCSTPMGKHGNAVNYSINFCPSGTR
ncbi:MAG: thaumatin family protein [Candidatus Electrothrix communis]|nr:MAG: thaumatin family protein [Candidatus Electrothrix communis]